MVELLVHVELLDGAPTDASLACLAKGRELAAASGVPLAASVLGSGIGEVARALGALGADVVYAGDDPRLASYLTTPYKKVLGDFVRQRAPSVVLMPASTVGNDLAPALATEVSAACVLDAHSASFDSGDSGSSGSLVFGRPEFDRQVMTRYCAVAGKSVVATLRDVGARRAAPDPARRAEVVRIVVALEGLPPTAKVLRRDVVQKTVNLRDAQVIVAGGAGAGSKEGFRQIEELALALGGEVGATRAAVDAGWVSAERQVGQTGVTVRPRLYVACGVSGAVQHRVGMMDAKTIVAINVDPAAPIFGIAHWRVVGDLKVVLPKLIQMLRARGAQR